MGEKVRKSYVIVAGYGMSGRSCSAQV